MNVAETKKVKNVSGATLALVGYGTVEADAVIEVPMSFHNANFETVSQVSKKEKDNKTDTETV